MQLIDIGILLLVVVLFFWVPLTWFFLEVPLFPSWPEWRLAWRKRRRQRAERRREASEELRRDLDETQGDKPETSGAEA